jgi:4-aminobutyrate aminotransferase-like enzyme
VAAEFTEAVEGAIKDLLRHGVRPAILICDTIFASDGVFAEPAGFLKGAVEAIRAAGGLYVADEVQSGFGRTGDAFWGFERHGAVPDIVTMGKPMGNGYPVAGVAVRPQVVERFGSEARYFNTFGGNAVAAQAALAVIGTIQSEGLVANSRSVGLHLRDRLRALSARHPCIGEVRGAGLFIGVDIVEGRDPCRPDAPRTARIVNGLREAGVLISACGKAANILKIRPPLILRTEQADLLVDTLDRVIGELAPSSQATR